MEKFTQDLKQAIKKALRDSQWQQWSRWLAAEEDAYSRNHKVAELTSAEVAEIRRVWGGICKDQRVGFDGFRNFKHHFDEVLEYVRAHPVPLSPIYYSVT